MAHCTKDLKMPSPLQPPAPAPQALLLDLDPALFGLLQEWLGAEGWSVVQASESVAPQRIDLIIVDLPYPRRHGVDLVAGLSEQFPTTPILAMSSTFFACIQRCGAVARSLGVTGVLPSPASRKQMVDAVRSVLPA